MSRQFATEFTPEDFCMALVAILVTKGKVRIPVDDGKVESAFRQILDELQNKATEAYQSGDEKLAFVLLGVLDGLSPNSNNGTFDQFWATLRGLQPSRLGMSNPLYPEFELKISKAHAEHELKRVPSKLHNVLHASAEALAQAV